VKNLGTLPRLLVWAALVILLLTGALWGQGDPQGSLDSFYVECGPRQADTVLIQLRFVSDNTDSNRIMGFGLPVLVSVSNNALVYLDTSVAATFAGSMVSGFDFLVTDTDSTGGADPTISPVHFVIGAVTLGNGVTGQGLFANLKLILTGDTTTVTVDTLSTGALNPSLVTEKADSYTPGWKSGGFTCGVTSSVRDVGKGSPSNLPTDFSLSQNYPNPFNATTIFEFAIPQAGQVSFELYNILGQKIRTLVDEQLSPGYKQVMWDGSNQRGETVASGVYFYKLKVGERFSEVKKMLLLR